MYSTGFPSALDEGRLLDKPAGFAGVSKSRFAGDGFVASQTKTFLPLLCCCTTLV